jgi:hypothetical protein
MADDESTQSTQDLPAVEAEAEQPVSESPSESPWQAQQAASEAEPRPELLLGGAFVGGFVFAKLLKRLRGGD